MSCPVIYHRLDRDDESGVQNLATPAAPEIRDVRLFMRLMADTVTYKFPNDAVPGRLDVLLNRRSNISEPRSRSSFGNSQVQRLARHAQQALGLGTDVPDRHRDRSVGVHAAVLHADVYADQIEQNIINAPEPAGGLVMGLGALALMARVRLGNSCSRRCLPRLMTGHH